MKKTVLIAMGLAAVGASAAVPALDTLIAHRGESIDAPENTLPAYKLAVERGFGFECDVYLSTDGRIFTFHDRTLYRTSGGAMTNHCTEANWETQVSTLNVGGWGKWKGSKYDPTRPALFEEVMALARPGRFIYVEIKDSPRIVPHLKKALVAQKTANPSNLLFICFSELVCAELKRQMPEYKVYWLTGNKEITAETIVAKLRKHRCDGVDARFWPDVTTGEYVRKVHDAGFEFHTWVVDSPRVAKLAFNRGVDTLTTDCPKELLDEITFEEREFPKSGLIAHRGDRADFPENTIPAFESAVKKGAEMIELDEWRCKSGELIVMHDETVDRTTNGKGRIADLTLAELKQLDAGSWKGPQFAGTRVPTLHEALAVFPKTGVLLNIHCKTGDAASEVAQHLLATGRKNQAILMMDNKRDLGVLRSKCPWARTGLVATLPAWGKVWSDESRAEQVAELPDLGIEFFQMLPKCHLTREQIDRLHAAGIKTTYFFCNDAEGFAPLVKEGHDYIFTDCYTKLRAAYDQAKK